jgi:dihydropyrimidinase
MKVLIRNGTVVNDDGGSSTDVLLSENLIEAVEPGITPPEGCRIIEADGLLVIPGGIDPHTHLEMPVGGIRTADGFDNGGKAALSGGTTTVIDFVNPLRGQSYVEAFEQWKGRAQKATCNYSFHVSVTWFDQQAADEISYLAERGGVNSFKHFTTYRDTIMLEQENMLKSFAHVAKLGCLATVHAENDEIITHLQRDLLQKGITQPKGHLLSRPPIAEAEATNRVIALAEIAGVPIYIVHLSCAGALEAVKAARARGQEVYAESLCGHLLLDESVYFNESPEIAARYVMSPPYRSKEHRDALWEGIAAESIQVTGSDNCTFMQKDRNRGVHDFTKIPNGSPGIEDRLRIIWDRGVRTGLLTREQFVAVTSTNAARIFNLYPRKGVIAPGSDADIVLWDAEKRHTVSARSHRQAIDYSVFEGFEFVGSPVATILNGQVVLENDELDVAPGTGNFIHRSPQR